MRLLHTAFLLCGLAGCSHTSHSLPANTPDKIREKVDSIVIIKHDRRMEVYGHSKLLTVYRVCLGSEPIGPKHFKDDGKTPEGIYHIDGKNPNSHYHKCLGIPASISSLPHG